MRPTCTLTRACVSCRLIAHPICRLTHTLFTSRTQELFGIKAYARLVLEVEVVAPHRENAKLTASHRDKSTWELIYVLAGMCASIVFAFALCELRARKINRTKSHALIAQNLTPSLRRQTRRAEFTLALSFTSQVSGSKSRAKTKACSGTFLLRPF